MFTFLKESFAGKEKLYKVWWWLGFPLAIFIRSTTRSVYSGNIPTNPTSYYLGFGGIFLLSVFWSICAWRCAPNVKNKMWMYIARSLVVMNVFASMGNTMAVINYVQGF